MLKLFSAFFGYLFLLFMLLRPIIFLFGAYLIWKGAGKIRILGFLLVFLVAYYQLYWVSPLLVMRGNHLVQEFKLSEVPFGSSPSVRWMEASNQLILVPDERVVFVPEPPEYNQVLVFDLELGETYWQPKAEVNLDATRPVKYLPTAPSQSGIRSEFSFISFSLPIPFYQIPWLFGEITGWQWEKNYFDWVRNVLQESKSGSVLVELNQIVFNAPQWRVGASSRWVMKGKFAIFEPELLTDRRVLVLGPFNTSQDTQSTNNKNN